MMGKIPNNIHIIYGLAENFGWDEYEHYVGEVDRVMKRPKADSFNIIRYLAIKSAHDVNNLDNIFGFMGRDKTHHIKFKMMNKTNMIKRKHKGFQCITQQKHKTQTLLNN